MSNKTLLFGSLAAGLSVACFIATCGALLSLSSDPATSLGFAAVFILAGAVAMRVIVASRPVGIVRCLLAGLGGGVLAGIGVAIVVALSLSMHRADMHPSMSFALSTMIACILGAFIGPILGIAMYPLAKKIAAAASPPLVLAPLDSSDRALAASGWWMLVLGACCAVSQGLRAGADAFVGSLALLLAAGAFVVVAAHELRRRRMIKDAALAQREPHDPDAPPPPRFLAARTSTTRSDLPVLCTGDREEMVLLETRHHHHGLRAGSGSSSVFRTAPPSSIEVAFLSHPRAQSLTSWRAGIAVIGFAVAIPCAILGVALHREMAHYRYRGPAPVTEPAEVDGFSGTTKNAAPEKLVAANGGVCALLTNHTVSCFGNNGGNRFIGLKYVQRYDAAPLSGLDHVSKISLGYAHACVLRDDEGIPQCWGGGRGGAIGDGTNVDRPLPTNVIGLDHVKDIALGSDTSIALREDGTVWQWGHKLDALQTRLPTDQIASPTRVATVEHVRKIALHSSHACVVGDVVDVKGHDHLACWGVADENPKHVTLPTIIELGDRDDAAREIRVLRVTDRTGYAIMNNGTVWAWGDRSATATLPEQGQRMEYEPIMLAALKGATDIAAGIDFVCGLMPNGDVVCSGPSYHTTGASIHDVVEMTSDDRGVCVIKKDHTVWCWGWL